MTPKLLNECVGCGSVRAKKFAAPLTAAMAEFAISTPRRQAAFLAQVGHESGRLTYVLELWGPTPTQARYEGRTDLGNTQPGDGFRYRGRGLVQVTGRANYEDVGAALGLPLVEQPELLELPDNAARSAAWFWREHGCNQFADAGQFERITRSINGGMNGQDDRLKLWERAKRALAAELADGGEV